MIDRTRDEHETHYTTSRFDMYKVYYILITCIFSNNKLQGKLHAWT